ncbi:Thioredoxin family protein [Trichomonas vaginalis G3]|uniref:Thioredoxin family protein n=1 Tax=Trichomonas vaginalis (strain ATCC PRA-98 / G3) TaxID=412133 RepID=A2F3E1_TRIV3|nr:disulfide-isomerase C17h9.14C-related family [Trichomonas vaginalis G3]EAY00588.1 Thioredoxin family protein [Trichomonas vaginalis G3]KAI5547876.1 disulfide-isomerase C17h9.14C-related family [Trichomonas vaginalis G3]|eukprot:XP_001313517.1 Thioredoxin family protein [Trichomonas vaginalis G3]
MTFFFAFLSRSLDINASTYAQIFNNSKNLPVFVEVWDPWCPHCMKFKDEWKTIKEDPQFADKVIISDINCNSNKNICKQFPGSETPRFFWVENQQTSPVRYASQVKKSEIINFINKNLYEQIIILNPEEYTDIKDKINKTTHEDRSKQYFVFNITNKDTASFNMARSIVSSCKHLPVHFILINDTYHHYPILYADIFGNPLKYEGKFDHSSISQFVKQRSLQYLSFFSETTNYYTQINKIDFAAFIFPNDTFYNISEFASLTLIDYSTVQTNCEFSPRFCRYIYQFPDKQPILAIVHRHSNLFYLYKSTFSKKGIEEFLKLVKEGKAKAYGPGNGLIGKVLDFYVSMRVQGGVVFYIIHIPIFSFVLFFLVIIYAIVDTIKESMKSRSNDKDNKID